MARPLPVASKFAALSGAALLLGALPGCGASGDAPQSSPTGAFSQIGPAETIHFTGTEPFWGGEVAGGVVTYTTPEDPQGKRFPAKRFAGNHGVSVSGSLDGKAFDLMITQSDCSDGMSDRTYPFHATLKIADETRDGCAWTRGKRYSDPRASSDRESRHPGEDAGD